MHIRKFLAVFLAMCLFFCAGCAMNAIKEQDGGESDRLDSGSEQTASTAGNAEGKEDAEGEETESIEENENTQSTESDEDLDPVTPEQQPSNGPASHPEENPEMSDNQAGETPEPADPEEGGQPEENPKTEDPADNETGAVPKNLTYKEYLALDAYAQQDYYNTFPDMVSFLAWYNHAKAVYEAENPPQYADGDITLG